MWKGDSYLKGVSIPILKLNGTDSLHLPSTLVFLLCYGLNSLLIRGTATGGRWKSGSRLKALYLSAYALLEPYKKGGRRPSAYEWIKNELSPSFLSNLKRREVTRKAVPAALREALQFVFWKPEESLCDAVSIKAVKDNSDLIYPDLISICSAGPFFDRNRGIPPLCLW